MTDPPDRPGYLRLLPPPADTRAPSGDRLDDTVGYLVLVRWEIDPANLRFASSVQNSPPVKRRYWPWVAELLNRIGDAEARERDAAQERAKLTAVPDPSDG
jgi:hypothetical protein